MLFDICESFDTGLVFSSLPEHIWGNFAAELLHWDAHFVKCYLRQLSFWG